jgi:hypothetical protein
MATNDQLNTGATPIAVSQGGLGANTLTTAYAPVYMDNSSTPIVKPVSGLSNSGYIMVSNGSSAAPSFVQKPVTVLTVTLSTSDIQNMYATPVLILANQGAHTVIVVYSVIFEFIVNTTVFGGTGAGPAIQYNNTNHSGGIKLFQTTILLTTANSKVAYGNAVNFPAGTYSGITGNIVNQGLYISNQIGAYTGGDSSAKVTLYYTVLSTTV